MLCYTKAVSFTYPLEILHLTEIFYTTSGCDGCDKYQVWIHEMGWMLRKQSLHHVVESGPRGKKVYCVAQRRQKWNNKLDSSTQHNYAKQMWRPKQLNNLCNTSGAAQPISLLYSAFPSFKELIAEHFSFFSAQPKPSLALHLFLVYRCNVSGWLESITYRCWFLVSYFTVALLKHWRRFHLFCNNYLSFFAFLRIVE